MKSAEEILNSIVADGTGIEVTQEEALRAMEEYRNQPTPFSEEEIERMAEDVIKTYPIYADLLSDMRWQTYINHLRMEWVKGYKAAIKNK